MVLQFFTESEGDTLAVNEGWKPKATPILDSHDIPYNPADCIRLGNENKVVASQVESYSKMGGW
jgi:hypothetical protein